MSRVPISEEQAQQMMLEQQAREERADAAREQRDGLLRACVSAEGRERLERLAQVRPDRARAAEVQLLQAVRAGRLQPPVGDDAVRDILERLGSQGAEAKSSSITFARKRMDDDW
ncbi:programmed cell death protein 5 [Trypanosoma theileri]|uniref:Programmed cell death protein 5 n=1 Tax=Trypanosoma theileri TaxID=67003 RepID=A0A1X0NQU5_9TRYP|nr:programmed cell death protein 5 [Trypanosoma theileri]ORC87086.1 programmed cell death protein 5 [Trypanosoma theileri]